MRDYQQLMQLFSGLGGMTLIWVQLGMAGLLTAVICWRRQAIVRINSFRQSFFWLSMSFIIPASLNLIVPLIINYFSFINTGMAGSRNTNPLGGWFGIYYSLAQAIPPLLVGVSILFLSRAIVPNFIPPHDSTPPDFLPVDDSSRAASPRRPPGAVSE